MLLTGIVLGFFAAAAQSLSYLFSRRYVLLYQKGASFSLLVIAHVIMGVFSGMILAFDNTLLLGILHDLIVPVLILSFSYITGQFGLIQALRTTETSRISPLLGLKIFFLALVSVVFIGQDLSAFQWISVLLSIAAALLLSNIGGKLPTKSLVWVTVAIMGYSLSDIYIKKVISLFSEISFLRASILTAACSYLFLGICGIFMLPFSKCNKREYWVNALPFSIAWFGGMIFLFSCFALIGVIFGNIVQCSRGIISIVLGVIVSRMGVISLEKRSSASTIFRQLIAALLMAFAIALFYVRI